MSESPVGRLAPSPTGLLHLGHARSFLLAWWSVRARGGRVVLRIEDLDRARCREQYVDACLADLEWLGLDWDGPVLRQSEDTTPYAEACAQLLAADQAYACICTRAEIAAAPHETDAAGRYPGTCAGRWASLDEARRDAGREPCLRVRAPEGVITVADDLAGTHSFDVAAEAGDFMIRRRDGVFAYQLAVVVDDARQGVTEVLRGDDLLSSAARQQHLFGLLGLRAPAWVHVPLVEDEHGERLAKRRGSQSLTALREGGIDGRRVVAWAARSAGQACEDLATAAEIAAAFEPNAIPRHPVALVAGQLPE